jgi:hypothetical protein
VTSHQSNKGKHSHNEVGWVTKTKNQIFCKMSTLPTHASWFWKSLSCVTKCMHPLQMNSFSSIFGSYSQPRDTKLSERKGINQISRETPKIHLKQLHAKNGTLAWYYGLDALLYSIRFMGTYLFLKTISFVHILKF